MRSHGAGGRGISAVIYGRPYALGLGEFADVLLGRRIEIDDAFRIPDRSRSFSM